MFKFNSNLLNINYENSFQRLSDEVNDFKLNNLNTNLISLSIGDVSLPVIEPVVDKMKEAVEDLSSEKTFKGYGGYLGYDFLKSAIREHEYKNFDISLDEIYISDGAKSDTTNILELFDINSRICVADPMYPVYKNGASVLNRNVTLLKGFNNDDFLPRVPLEKFDIIYMCSPSNPIGIVYPKSYLEEWVNYALENNSIILYDNVYSDFINSKDAVKSIYEIKNAKKVAIEFRSFSKSISFTGVRCSYYVIPNDIDKDINKLWKLRTINRFNGASYIAQKGALAIYSDEVQQLISNNIKYYLDNARYLKDAFLKSGFKVWGGTDSPYLWIQIKDGRSSWEEFYYFLNNLGIVIVPGIIFGDEGNRYFRVSSLGKREDVMIAVKRISDFYEKEA